MTEKEKAIELVEKYKPYMYPFGPGSAFLTGDREGNSVLKDAKECARIAVSEVINQLNVAPLFNGSRTSEADKVWAYWVEVEQEIIKL